MKWFQLSSKCATERHMKIDMFVENRRTSHLIIRSGRAEVTEGATWGEQQERQKQQVLVMLNMSTKTSVTRKTDDFDPTCSTDASHIRPLHLHFGPYITVNTRLKRKHEYQWGDLTSALLLCVFLLTEDMALIHCLLAIGVGWCVCFCGSDFHMNVA